MARKTCNLCYYYEARTGFCRSKPPVVMMARNHNHDGDEVLFSTTMWPKPDADRDWCGDYEPG